MRPALDHARIPIGTIRAVECAPGRSCALDGAGELVEGNAEHDRPAEHVAEERRVGALAAVVRRERGQAQQRLRVAVVDRGRVIALGSPAELIARLGGDHVIEFAINGGGGLSGALAEQELMGLPAVRSVRVESTGIHLTVTEPHVAIPGLLQKLSAESLELARLTTRHVSLEDVFVDLTGRHLRDDQPPSA